MSIVAIARPAPLTRREREGGGGWVGGERMDKEREKGGREGGRLKSSFLFLFFFHQSSLYPIKIFVKCFYLLVFIWAAAI